MAIRKMAAKPTAEDLRIADRVRRARARMPSSDPTGEYSAAIIELARSIGMDIDDALDQWEERSASRQYDAGMTLDDAERLAVEDMRDMYERQRRLVC